METPKKHEFKRFHARQIGGAHESPTGEYCRYSEAVGVESVLLENLGHAVAGVERYKEILKGLEDKYLDALAKVGVLEEMVRSRSDSSEREKALEAAIRLHMSRGKEVDIKDDLKLYSVLDDEPEEKCTPTP